MEICLIDSAGKSLATISIDLKSCLIGAICFYEPPLISQEHHSKVLGKDVIQGKREIRAKEGNDIEKIINIFVLELCIQN